MGTFKQVERQARQMDAYVAKHRTGQAPSCGLNYFRGCRCAECSAEYAQLNERARISLERRNARWIP